MSEQLPEDYLVRLFCKDCGKNVIATREHHWDYGPAFDEDELVWYSVDYCQECGNVIED